jgi:hypothetical protein
MGTHVAPAPAIRPSRIVVGLIAVALVSALALGVGLATRAISFDSLTANVPQSALADSTGGDQRIGGGTGTIVRSHLVAGYPAHYGLAGPSRIGSNAGSWTGYPSHYGLAGPSRLGTMTAPISVGAGYPAHNGLAGPSQVGR